MKRKAAKVAIGVKTMTKVKVVFFASLKESIKQDTYTVECELPMTIAKLKEQLSSELEYGQSLLDKGIQSSIDFEFSRDSDQVTESVQEVAFFPPVTGG